MDKILALQLGNRDWKEIYVVPDNLELHYVNELKKKPKKLYDLVFLDRTPYEYEMDILHQATKAYTLFVTKNVELTGKTDWLYHCKKGKTLMETKIQDFLLHETRNYFSQPYGEKFSLKNLSIAQGFSGSVKWNGSYCVCLDGDFGEAFCQAVFWRNNFPIYPGQCIDLWLEYEKDDGVSINLVVTQFISGTYPGVQQKWEFSEYDLEQGVRIDYSEGREIGYVFVSLSAKGKGRLQVIALHDRHSRRGHGDFLPGGKRYIASNREEVFCYFDPGDRKPPLNVYFSGYKTMEGFEGYFMMRRLGAPFLLVAEARLEGGCFYIGSQEYEALIRNRILASMHELGFSSEQVILSGISMGSFGAMYYGCDIRPHTVLMGKPLLNIGNVAANGRYHRPNAFATSFDILNYLCGSLDKESVKRLNRRFWDKFDRTDWGKSKIIASYMFEDDYDADAYPGLLSHLHSDGVELYGKGFHGRHNDNSAGVVDWFFHQLKQIVKQDFGRREEE